MKPKLMRIAAVINGNDSSAAAVRANHLLLGLGQNYEVEFFYNQRGRFRTIISFMKALIVSRPRIIYLSGTALPGAIAVLILCLPLRAKVIIDTGDLGFELARNVGLASTLQLQLIRVVEQIILRIASKIIVRGSYHKTLLEQQKFKNVAFLPDGVDCAVFRPLTDVLSLEKLTQLRQQLGLTGNFVVGTVGSSIWSEKLQMAYGWDLIEALAFLKDLPIKALIVARGSGIEYLRKRASELNVSDKLCLIEGVPHQELITYLHLMDVCVSTQTNNNVGWVRTTGKLPEYMAAGRFILATAVGEASLVLKPYGMLLPYLSEGKDHLYPARLAERVRQLYFDPQELNQATELPNLACNLFEYKKLNQEFVSIIDELALGIKSVVG